MLPPRILSSVSFSNSSMIEDGCVVGPLPARRSTNRRGAFAKTRVTNGRSRVARADRDSSGISPLYSDDRVASDPWLHRYRHAGGKREPLSAALCVLTLQETLASETNPCAMRNLR